MCKIIKSGFSGGEQIRVEFTFKVSVGHQFECVSFDDLAIAVQGGAFPVTFEDFVARKMDDNLQNYYRT